MSSRDQQDPIDSQELPNSGAGAPGPGSPRTGPRPRGGGPSHLGTWETKNSDAPVEDPSAEPPAFILSSIPIPPPKAINAPASRALASGDELIELAGGTPGVSTSNPPRRIPMPDELAAHRFEYPLPSDPNPTVSRPPSTITRGDRLTEALRPETSEPDEDLASKNYSGPDFPITPIRPFAAPPHAEPVSEDSAPTVSLDAGPADVHGTSLDSSIPPPNFHLQPEPETRIPNFGHLSLLAVIALFGLVAAGLAAGVALHFHLWGVTTTDKAATDIHYTLASMAVLYVFSFGCAFFLFPRIWHKPFFAALQWNSRAAVRYRYWLFAAASFCFVLAVVDEFLLPGPTSAPIDKLFSNTTAAWLLFAFGVLVAPFFEEITFRGFLLPALCTACDWIAEYLESETQWSRPALVLGSPVASSALAAFAEQKFGHHRPVEWLLVSCFIALVCIVAVSWLYQRYQAVGAGSRVRPLGPNGHPQWSLAAMIIGSLLTSLPFAAIHADQTGYSLGPFVLLFCVSLILCFARLATRSLAASTLVHASYNFILFALMLVGTGGFKHLDKM
jgi:membrane protease YdiL (CAAX protease family)